MYRYENILETKDNTGERYYRNNIYPDIVASQTDLYVITVLGDRLDLLALDFYGDMDYWWIIASANSLPGDSIYPPIGVQLRIPLNPLPINNFYRSENETR
jgi:hypothetical protein